MIFLESFLSNVFLSNFELHLKMFFMSSKNLFLVANFKKLIFLAIVFLAFSCRNKTDEIYPVVQFFTPYENSHHSVLDTIHIEADLSDNEQIVSVEVSLTDENFTPVLRTYNVPVKSNPMKLVFDYPLTDYFMEGGIYNLLIKVSDGEQIKHKYQRINIIAVEKKMIGLAIATSSGASNEISILDSGLINQILISSEYDNVDGIAIIPYQNKLGFVYEYSNKVEVWDYKLKQKNWSYTNTDPTGVLYRVNSQDKSFFSFIGNGVIKQFNYNGTQKLVINDPDYVAMKLVTVGQYFVVISMSIHTPFYYAIRVYHSASGALVQTYTLDFKAYNIFYLGNNKLLISGNQNNIGQIREYNLQDNTLWKPRDLSGGTLKEVVEINSNEYLLHLESAIKKLKINDYSVVDISLNPNYYVFQYEPINNYLIIEDGSTIRILDYSTFNQVWEKSMGSTVNINLVYPLYNR